MRKTDYYSEFLRLSKMIRQVSFASSDSDCGEKMTDEIVNRDQKYSKLLESYISITKIRLVCKEIHKWLFFWMVIVACFFIVSLSYRLIVKVIIAEDLRLVIDAIPALLTAFTAFVSTVIVVPLTITKFLFNTKEDDNITSIVQHTQQHDTATIEMLKERFARRLERSEHPSKSSCFNSNITDD